MTRAVHLYHRSSARLSSGIITLSGKVKHKDSHLTGIHGKRAKGGVLIEIITLLDPAGLTVLLFCLYRYQFQRTLRRLVRRTAFDFLFLTLVLSI